MFHILCGCCAPCLPAHVLEGRQTLGPQPSPFPDEEPQLPPGDEEEDKDDHSTHGPRQSAEAQRRSSRRFSISSNRRSRRERRDPGLRTTLDASPIELQMVRSSLANNTQGVGNANTHLSPAQVFFLANRQRLEAHGRDAPLTCDDVFLASDIQNQVAEETQSVNRACPVHLFAATSTQQQSAEQGQNARTYKTPAQVFAASSTQCQDASKSESSETTLTPARLSSENATQDPGVEITTTNEDREDEAYANAVRRHEELALREVTYTPVRLFSAPSTESHVGLRAANNKRNPRTRAQCFAPITTERQDQKPQMDVTYTPVNLFSAHSADRQEAVQEAESTETSSTSVESIATPSTEHQGAERAQSNNNPLNQALTSTRGHDESALPIDLTTRIIGRTPSELFAQVMTYTFAEPPSTPPKTKAEKVKERNRKRYEEVMKKSLAEEYRMVTGFDASQEDNESPVDEKKPEEEMEPAEEKKPVDKKRQAQEKRYLAAMKRAEAEERRIQQLEMKKATQAPKIKPISDKRRKKFEKNYKRALYAQFAEEQRSKGGFKTGVMTEDQQKEEDKKLLALFHETYQIQSKSDDDLEEYQDKKKVKAAAKLKKKQKKAQEKARIAEEKAAAALAKFAEKEVQKEEKERMIRESIQKRMSAKETKRKAKQEKKIQKQLKHEQKRKAKEARNQGRHEGSSSPSTSTRGHEDAGVLSSKSSNQGDATVPQEERMTIPKEPAHAQLRFVIRDLDLTPRECHITEGIDILEPVLTPEQAAFRAKNNDDAAAYCRNFYDHWMSHNIVMNRSRERRQKHSRKILKGKPSARTSCVNEKPSTVKRVICRSRQPWPNDISVYFDEVCELDWVLPDWADAVFTMDNRPMPDNRQQRHDRYQEYIEKMLTLCRPRAKRFVVQLTDDERMDQSEMDAANEVLAVYDWIKDFSIENPEYADLGIPKAHIRIREKLIYSIEKTIEFIAERECEKELTAQAQAMEQQEREERKKRREERERRKRTVEEERRLGLKQGGFKTIQF